MSIDEAITHARRDLVGARLRAELYPDTAADVAVYEQAMNDLLDARAAYPKEAP